MAAPSVGQSAGLRWAERTFVKGKGRAGWIRPNSCGVTDQNKTTPRNQRNGAHDSTAPHAPPQAGTELTHPTGRFPSGEPWATVRHTRTRHGSTPASRALIRRHGPRISRPEPKIDLSWPRGTIGGDRRSRLNGASA